MFIILNDYFKNKYLFNYFIKVKKELLMRNNNFYF